MRKGSNSSVSSPVLVIFHFLGYSHSSECPDGITSKQSILSFWGDGTFHRIPSSFPAERGPERAWTECELDLSPPRWSPHCCAQCKACIAGIKWTFTVWPEEATLGPQDGAFPQDFLPTKEVWCIYKEQLGGPGTCQGFSFVLIIVLINFHPQSESPNGKSYFHLFLSFSDKWH